MSLRANTGIAILAAAAFIAGAVSWPRVHDHQTHTARVSRKSGSVGSSTIAGTDNLMPKEVSARMVRGIEKPAAEAKPATVDGPLRNGEVLEFTANVSKLSNVANLRVRVIDRPSFLGKTVWHLQASAHTENPLRMVFALDDQFDSYSDVGALTSLQYEMHLDEHGQKAESVQRLVTSVRAPADVTAAIVLPGTRDPLGMLEYLRSVDWAKSPEVRSPVYDGRKLYDVRAKLLSNAEKVTVPAGEYVTSKIGLRVFDNGAEMKDSHFFLYLTNSSARTPTLLEAVLPFADARVELVRYRPGQ